MSDGYSFKYCHVTTMGRLFTCCPLSCDMYAFVSSFLVNKDVYILGPFGAYACDDDDIVVDV